MDITPIEIEAYCEAHTSPESVLLKKINRDTHANVLMPRMLSGHWQGRMLAMLSQMIKPKAILEIGTYTGYSALCLAEGLQPAGKLITIDINEELAERVSGYFQTSTFANKIQYCIGNALEIIPTLKDSFDLVFIDADKANYVAYYDLIFDKVPVGGYIMADNVLWSGKVLAPNPDKDTRAILAFNRKIAEDPRVENVLLPARDGLFILRKVTD